MKSAFLRLGTVACLLGVGSTASAQIPYTFVDVQGSFAEIDVLAAPGEPDVDATGARITGSLGIFPFLHVLGGFESLRPDDLVVEDPAGVNPPTVYVTDDVNTYEVGLGLNTTSLGRADRQYRGGVIDRYSLFADARFLGQDRGGTDINGWAVNVGARSINFTRMETLLGFGYEDFEKLDGEFTFQGQILFRIVGNLQLRGGLNWSDDISRWNVGLRYHFGDWSIFR